MNIGLAIMGVIFFVLILIGFFMMVKISPDFLGLEFVVFYFITMSVLSVVMMSMMKMTLQ